MDDLDLKHPLRGQLIDRMVLLLRDHGDNLPVEYYREMAERVYMSRDAVSFLIGEYDRECRE